jgi:NhaP-type Na+/H+ or K+/H+ antiporter
MEATILQTVTVALILGVASFTLAKRLRIPAILFYLLSGTLMGPLGLHFLNVKSLGTGLVTLVEIGVAIILFEGGLSLSTRSFRTESTSIRRILIITIPLTGIGAASLAHFFLEMTWELAIFFGALIVVTGPTVIGSILKSLYLNRRLEILLHWESIWGDVVGVLLSAVALEMVISSGGDSLTHLGLGFLFRMVDGVIVGLSCGYLMGRFLMPWAVKLREHGLSGLLAVAGALVVFDLANVFVEASGPVAVAIAGFVLSHFKAETIHDIRHFKEQLSSLFIGTLFVLLSAAINPLELARAWPMMLFVALVLGAFVRPLSVLLALWGTDVSWRERIYVGIIGPRGIIALATASYAAVLLPERGGEMAILLNLTFAIIFLSGAIATIICGPLARALKVSVRESELGILLVGMNRFSTELANFAARYVPVAFADTSADTCSLAQAMGHETVCADVLDHDLYEDGMEQGFGRLVAVTTNDALNQMIAQAAAIHMGPEKVFRVQALADEDMIVVEANALGGVAFSIGFFVQEASRMLDQGKARLEILSPDMARARGATPLLELSDGGTGFWIIRAGEPLRGQGLCLTPVEQK